MGIDNLQFLQASRSWGNYNPQPNYAQPKTQYAMPTTTAQVQPAYKPTVEDYERAQAFIDGNYNTEINPFAKEVGKTGVQSAKGAAFEGYKTPENNGTGELRPDVSNRVDSIEDCPWEAYYA